MLNRSEKEDIATRIENTTGKLSGDIQVWEMNHADLKATHTFGDDRKVRPATRTVPGSGNTIAYNFPKHSLTILRVNVHE